MLVSCIKKLSQDAASKRTTLIPTEARKKQRKRMRIVDQYKSILCYNVNRKYILENKLSFWLNWVENIDRKIQFSFYFSSLVYHPFPQFRFIKFFPLKLASMCCICLPACLCVCAFVSEWLNSTNVKSISGKMLKEMAFFNGRKRNEKKRKTIRLHLGE